jgi:uncharacterized membrane protein
MAYLIAYLLALVIFTAVDIAWLSTVGAEMFRRALGDMLLPSFRIGPAVFFYLLYPIGLMIFAIQPGLKTESAVTAATYGALLGLFAYATYELTNYATLRNWTFQLFAVDTLWGTFASGLAAGLVVLVAPFVFNLLGVSGR